jgi:hypothetical protein
VAWRGVAWRGVAWRGVAWRGAAWRGVAWRGVAWRRVAWRVYVCVCVRVCVQTLALRNDSGSCLRLTGLHGHNHWMHRTRQNSSGQVISQTQRPLPDNTQHSQQTCMPPVGFEPTIPASERTQTHAARPLGSAYIYIQFPSYQNTLHLHCKELSFRETMFSCEPKETQKLVVGKTPVFLILQQTV